MSIIGKNLKDLIENALLVIINKFQIVVTYKYHFWHKINISLLIIYIYIKA